MKQDSENPSNEVIDVSVHPVVASEDLPSFSSEETESTLQRLETSMLALEEALSTESESVLNTAILENTLDEAANEWIPDPEATQVSPEGDEDTSASQLDFSGPARFQTLKASLEALLLVAEKPLKAERLHELVDAAWKSIQAARIEGAPTVAGPSQDSASAVDTETPMGPEMDSILFSEVQEALTELKLQHQQSHHGVELREVAGGYQLRTKREMAPVLRQLTKIQVQRLSAGAMEVLSMIAFKQPCLKDDIDSLRGVDSSHFLRTLLDRKLIRIAGRSEQVGRPMVYETTEEFLALFGLKSLQDLPSLREIENMIPSSEAGAPGEEIDPRVRKMRKLVHEMKLDDSTRLLYDPKEDEAFLQGIREKVKGISTSTPTLDAMNEEAKAPPADPSPGASEAQISV
jgi:segregation and condensation protein B